jgi:hypothetical protein
MKRTLIVIFGIGALAAGGAAIASAGGGGDSSKPVPSGPDRDRAEAVALQETGGGRVTGTEINDEEGAYEIEVTRGDGTQVDVHLDSAFHVLNAKADHGDSGEAGSR